MRRFCKAFEGDTAALDDKDGRLITLIRVDHSQASLRRQPNTYKKKLFKQLLVYFANFHVASNQATYRSFDAVVLAFEANKILQGSKLRRERRGNVPTVFSSWGFDASFGTGPCPVFDVLFV